MDHNEKPDRQEGNGGKSMGPVARILAIILGIIIAMLIFLFYNMK